MKKFSTPFQLLVLLIILPEPVFSEETSSACEATIGDITPPSTISYYPYDRGMQTEIIELSIDAPQDCGLSLTVATSQRGMRGSQGYLSYYIEDSRGNRIVTDGTRRIPINSHKRNSQVIFHTLTPMGQDASPGVYQEEIRFQLFDSESLIDEKIISFNAKVFHQAVISAAKSRSSGFTFNQGTVMDFGNLYTGQQQSAYIFVRSNSHYSLELESENNGRLINRNSSSSAGYINYTAWLNRKRLNLNPSDTVSFRRAETLGLQSPHELSIQVGEVKNNIAGSYRDLLTVNVIILE